MLAAGLFFGYYLLEQIRYLIQSMNQLRQYLSIDNIYMESILKMIGITYIGQFSAGICKDAGYQATASQIELFCKLTVMVLSIPVLMALLETIQEFLG